MSAILKALQNRKVEVELKSEKVELGIVQDFDKLFDSVNDKDTNIGLSLIKALSKAEADYKKIINEWSEVAKSGGKGEVLAKELGVELPKTFKNKIDSAESSIKEVQKYIGKISSLYSMF